MTPPQDRPPQHVVAFERRPTARPSRYELRLRVDGVDLCDLVRAVEEPSAAAEGDPSLAGRYAGLQWGHSVDPEPILRHYLGKTDPYHLDDGRAEVLACECGETGCWPLVCRIEASVDEVRWSDFAQPHRAGRQSPPRHPGLWRYDGFGPFVFDRRQYEAALLAALPDAVRERIGREASSTLGEDGSMADAERLAAVVYVLQHEYEAAGGYDEVKFIGVYRSRERAEVAVERLRTQPGFVDHPEGFCIDAYELDLDHWTDGFFSSP